MKKDPFFRDNNAGLPDTGRMIFFQKNLLKWFEKNGRKYPWRIEKDPFKILIAEMMLQRTRADQVLPVYLEFIMKWHDSKSLCSANIEEVDAIFAKLGLSWRGKLLSKMAENIQIQHKGRVPDVRSELLNISGVGDYISDAIMVFAFNKRRTIIDSNVVRLVTRFFGLSVKGEMRRNKEFIRFCQKLTEELQTPKVKKFNWGLLDHSAAICRSVPRCQICTLSQKCSYFEKRQQVQNNSNTVE